MYYKLLGMAVWHGGKFLVRRRFGVTLSKPLVAGAAMAAVTGAGLAVAAARRTVSSD
jgi:hypothetical protein